MVPQFSPAFVARTSSHRSRMRERAFSLGLRTPLNVHPEDGVLGKFQPSQESLFYFYLGREQQIKNQRS